MSERQRAATWSGGDGMERTKCLTSTNMQLLNLLHFIIHKLSFLQRVFSFYVIDFY